MADALVIDFDDALYDKAVRVGPPEGGDLRLIVKDRATVDGWPAVAITFTVQMPDGKLQQVQAVTTAKLFLGAATALRARVAALGLDLPSSN